MVLNGKNTGNLRVTLLDHALAGRILVTNLERTLIDITVRPDYSGGPIKILQAFQRARARANTRTLIHLLKSLEYVYPYHQTIGFFMEKAKFPKDQYEQLRQFGINFEFFVAHGMAKPHFDYKWRVYYPRSLESHLK